MKPATALPLPMLRVVKDRGYGWARLETVGALKLATTTQPRAAACFDAIAARCNAYPELVAALRALLKAQDDEAGSLYEAAEARRVLAKLGEP